ncbi:hypothetical protein GALL_487460 [mine drainage metagenome]|uniref:Uncharacterized protein n=1 Tax=mine drainage metagenome TaxID=410659 RepID=A0A1J5PWG4_9ZZZZ
MIDCLVRHFSIEISNQRFICRVEAFECFTVKIPIAIDKFFGNRCIQSRCERRGAQAENGIDVAFQEPSAAIPRKPRVARHPDQAMGRRHGAANVEHGVQHSGHRSGSPGTNRHQQRLATVSEAFSGLRFQPLDSLGEALGQLSLGLAIALDDLSAELDGQHERGRNR